MLLWINLISNGLPALALGMDPPDRELMKELPRRSGAGLVGGRELLGIGGDHLGPRFGFLRLGGRAGGGGERGQGSDAADVGTARRLGTTAQFCGSESTRFGRYTGRASKSYLSN
jgi:hypothetical protein